VSNEFDLYRKCEFMEHNIQCTVRISHALSTVTLATTVDKNFGDVYIPSYCPLSLFFTFEFT